MSSYESYNQRLGLGPNAHDDLKSSSTASPQRPAAGSMSHDPYRFTRSTQQPIQTRPNTGLPVEPPTKPIKPPDYPKYR